MTRMSHHGIFHRALGVSLAADSAATVTRSSRQTPNPSMTVQASLGALHEPDLRRCPAGHDMHALDPDPEHVAHDDEHATQLDLAVSKYSLEAHVATHEPDGVRTGREGGQVRQVVELDEQVAQSGWQARQVDVLEDGAK